MDRLDDKPSRLAALLLIGVVLLISLTVRLAVFQQVRDDPLYQVPTLDEQGNHRFAKAILHGDVPEAAYYKAPLYTYLLAGVYAVIGDDSLQARQIQTVVVAITPVLIALTAYHLFGLTVGFVAGIGAALHWTFVFFSAELLDTAVACLFYALLGYGLVAWDDRRVGKWLACGVILGLGAITRPNILAFAPALFATVLIVGWRRLRRERSVQPPAPDGHRVRVTAWQPLVWTMALTIGCCAAVLPVTLRNRIVGGEWVLLGAYGGLNVHVANNPHSDSKDGPLLVDESVFTRQTTWDPNQPWAECCLNFKNAYRYAEGKLGRPPTRGEFSTLLAREGFAFLAENPTWFASHALRRFCWLFSAYEYPSNKDLYHFLQFSSILQALSHVHYGWMVPFGVLGLVLALRDRCVRSTGLVYMLVLLAALVLPAVLFIINARFRLPMVQVMVIFAAYGLVQLIGMIIGRRPRRELIWAAPLVLALAVFSNLDLFGYRRQHYPYLRLAYAVACIRAERPELLDDALGHFAHDLEADLAELRARGRRSNTTLLLDHCNPMRLLLPYYLQHNREEAALWSARLMLENEDVTADWALRLFDLFYEAGDREGARQALDILEQRAGPNAAMPVAQCLYRFGLRWSDPGSLKQARSLLEATLRLNPGDAAVRRLLDQVKASLSPRATSRPA